MTTTTYTAADFEGRLIAHKGNSLALRRDISKLPWSVHVRNRDLGVYANSTWVDDASLASEGWTPGPPPRNGNEQANEQDQIIRRQNEDIEDLEQDVRERDETIKEQRAAIEDLRKAVWERGEIIGDLREDLDADQALIPSTPKEAITLAWELACPVSEKQMIPAGTPFIEKFGDGEMVYRPDGEDWKRTARVDGALEIRTLAPLPASRPKHAEVIERELDVCIGGDDNEGLADTIARAIEEQEGDR